jgi:hypothetical protein
MNYTEYLELKIEKYVSPIALYEHLGGLEGIETENFYEDYADFNPNVENSVKLLAKIELKGNLDKYPYYQQYLFNSYRYFLTLKTLDFRDLMESYSYMPFNIPTDSRQFFMWIFEELFPRQSYFLENTQEYILTTYYLIHSIICSRDNQGILTEKEFLKKVSLYDFYEKFNFIEA